MNLYYVSISNEISFAKFHYHPAFIDSNEPGLQSNDIVANFSSKQITTCTGSTDGSLSIPSASQSIESDRGSNNVYETSELHFSTRKPSGHNLITNGNGLTIESASDQIDSAHRINNIFHGNNASGITAKTELLPEAEHDKHPSHSRMVSSESVGSDISSIRGSEISIPSTYNSLGDAYVSLSGVTGNNIILPLNQQNKLNRLLITLQRRLTTGKTDMEDLIARLNQEMAVKEYLKTKVCLSLLLFKVYYYIKFRKLHVFGYLLIKLSTGSFDK